MPFRARAPRNLHCHNVPRSVREWLAIAAVQRQLSAAAAARTKVECLECCPAGHLHSLQTPCMPLWLHTTLLRPYRARVGGLQGLHAHRNSNKKTKAQTEDLVTKTFSGVGWREAGTAALNGQSVSDTCVCGCSRPGPNVCCTPRKGAPRGLQHEGKKKQKTQLRGGRTNVRETLWGWGGVGGAGWGVTTKGCQGRQAKTWDGVLEAGEWAFRQTGGGYAGDRSLPTAWQADFKAGAPPAPEALTGRCILAEMINKHASSPWCYHAARPHPCSGDACHSGRIMIAAL